MNLIKLKKGGEIFPLIFPHEIKSNGKFRYFIEGKGYKETKSYETFEADLPDLWDQSLNWIDICRIYEKYGYYVAYRYAQNKVAGIIAGNRIRDYYTVYKKIKDLIDEDFDPSFFEQLKGSYKLSVLGIFSLDVVGLDDRLSKKDKRYDSENCTFDGKENVSMQDYIQLAYGDKYVKVLNRLLS